MSRPIRAVIHPQQQAWIDEQVARYRDVLMRSCAEAVVIAREEPPCVFDQKTIDRMLTNYRLILEQRVQRRLARGD
jgi:hypothetical protein